MLIDAYCNAFNDPNDGIDVAKPATYTIIYF